MKNVKNVKSSLRTVSGSEAAHYLLPRRWIRLGVRPSLRRNLISIALESRDEESFGASWSAILRLMHFNKLIWYTKLKEPTESEQ